MISGKKTMAVNTTLFTPDTTDVSPLPIYENDLLNAILLIIFGVLVNLCNLLVIITVLNFRSLSNPDVLIFALALVDYISSMLLFPITAYVYLSHSADTTHGVVCDIFAAVSTCAQLLSTSIITLMTLDRFLAIRKPIFYKNKLSVPNLKRTIVFLFIVSVALSCIPILMRTFQPNVSPHDTKTLCFSYPVPYAYIILAWSFPQIPIVIYTYIGFIVYIRQFVSHKSQNSFDSIGRRKRSRTFQCRRQLACCGYVLGCRDKDNAQPTRQEILEKTLAMMKSLNLKRCTRMANTVIWIVLIYYVAWTFTLCSMTYQLVTETVIPVLNFVAIRLILLDSVLNPIVYAVECINYRRGFQWAICYPFRICGYRKHTRRSALGLTVSEMQRITHRMAVDQWESPGINPRSRRQHNPSKPVLKSYNDYGNNHNPADQRETIHGHDNLAFDIDSDTCHQTTPSTERRTTAVVESNTISDVMSNQHSPGSQKGSIGHKTNYEGQVQRRLHKQPSDSGVDVDSIYLEGAVSGCSSPTVNRTIENRRSFKESTKSDPGDRRGREIESLTEKIAISSNRMQSVRVDTPHNAWHSTETLVKIHVDVLELLNESAMLGPYCLQSQLKRCKLRSSDQPPSLRFSAKQNKFIARRTSFDDLDGYYVDFTTHKRSSSKRGNSKQQHKPMCLTTGNLETNKSSTLTRYSLDTTSSPFATDDIVLYSNLLMQKHLEDQVSTPTERVEDELSGHHSEENAINQTNDITDL